MLVLLAVPVFAAPLPAVLPLFAVLLPLPLLLLPLVAGVDDDAAGNVVIGVGGSGIGLDNADATNVFNHPTWFIGNQTITSTNFGKITSNFFGRRLVQFALYYRF